MSETTMPSGELAPTPTELLKALTKAIPRIHAIPKNGRHERHGYAFAREEDVLEYVREILAEEGLVLQLVGMRPFDGAAAYLAEHAKTRNDAVMWRFDALVRYRLWHVSGQWLDYEVPASGIDTDDKFAPKALTGAMKAVLRQALLLTFGGEPEDGRTRGGSRSSAPADDGAPVVKRDELTNWPKFLAQDQGGEYLLRVPVGAGAGKALEELADVELAATGKAARLANEKDANRRNAAWLRGAEHERDRRAAAKAGQLPLGK